jgi:uncharacterized SAM-binding protein YcdF (DUF218 family)
VFFLSKFLPPLLLPPGLFLVLLALVFFLRRRRRAALPLAIMLVLSLYLLSIRPIADSLILPLEDSFPHPARTSLKCDVIVVLGGDVLPNSPDMQGAAAPGPAAMQRAYAAFSIWRKMPAPVVVSGGSSHGEEWNSARAMGAVLEDLGIHRDFQILEEESRNTIQNAEFSARLLDERELISPCLVSSAYHLPRAVMSFAAFGVAVVPVPTGYMAYRESYSWHHFLPSAHSLAVSNTALHEYLGILYYMLVHGV